MTQSNSGNASSMLYAQHSARATDEMPLSQFAEKYYQERRRAGLDLNILWLFLDKKIQDKYSVKSLRQNLLSLKENPLLTIASELGEAILSAYSKVPSFTAPVSSREALYVNDMARAFPFYMSAKVAKEQLWASVKKLQPAWNEELLKYSFSDFLDDHGGLPKGYAKSIFAANDNDLVLRLRVAICLAIIEKSNIPETTIELQDAFPEKSVVVRERAPSVEGNLEVRFERASLPVADVRLDKVEKNDAVSAPENILRYDEFHEFIKRLEKDRHVEFKSVVSFLPEQFQFALKRYLSAVDRVDKRPLVKISFEVLSCVAGFYDDLPRQSDRAELADLALETKFNQSLHLQMLVSVAKEQISNGMKVYQKSPRRLIEAMVEKGYPRRSVDLLLNGATGEYVSRRLVAATLEEMGVFKDAGQDRGHDQEREYLPDGLFEVRKVTGALTKIFNKVWDGEDLLIEDVYDYMDPSYKTKVSVQEIQGWFDGSITIARKAVVEMFMSAAIARLEDRSDEPEVEGIDVSGEVTDLSQIDLLNYQPRPHPVQLHQQL